MHKKSPLIVALSIALLLTAKTYSQTADASATAKPSPKAAAVDLSTLPPAKIIDKLQEQVIDWQDQIIRGMESQAFVQIIYRDMAGIALNDGATEVRDQKMLDLLTKYGLGVTSKDGKKLNTPSAEADIFKVEPDTVPFVEVKEGTREEKSRIHALLEKEQTLADRATQAKKWAQRLEIAAMDLLELGKTDSGAQSLVDKYHIKTHAPSPAPAAAASPSPTP